MNPNPSGPPSRQCYFGFVPIELLQATLDHRQETQLTRHSHASPGLQCFDVTGMPSFLKGRVVKASFNHSLMSPILNSLAYAITYAHTLDCKLSEIP